MQPTNDHLEDELIDLGSVEATTRGAGGEKDDQIGGLRPSMGLSDD